MSAAVPPALAAAPDDPADAAFIKVTVDTLAATVDQEYFNPAVATRVDAESRRGLAEGRYAGAKTPRELAGLLTADLYAMTHDKHLGVIPVRPDQNRQADGRRDNYGVQGAEVLPGNIGCLNITRFYRPGEAGKTIAAAMLLLQNADALILDLRANLGGSPDTAALVASYRLDRPGLPPFDIVSRSGAVQRYATETGALTGRDGRPPLYVLTSTVTFSAVEGLAFILKEQKRAEMIGETTAGAANPGRDYPLNDALEAFVPNGRVRGAVSGGNWEGAGVAPNINVPTQDALQTAELRARGEVLGRKLAELRQPFSDTIK